MAQYLKHGKSESEQHQVNNQVKETVTGIIAEVEKEGDAAVRRLSEKFDKWSPPSFRLSDQQVKDIIAAVA